MEEFNLLEEMLSKSRIVINNRFYVVGKKGNENEVYYQECKYCAKDRTGGSILLYDKNTESLEWKSLYRSSKGLYFKKKGRFYI